MSYPGFDEKWLREHAGGMKSATPSQIRRAMRDSAAALVREGAAPKRQKFNAQPTVTRGRKFASKKEAQRYHELLLRLKAGEIRRLECQPVYVMHTENESGEWIACGKFTPDFRYLERVEPDYDKAANVVTSAGYREVIEDVKGGRATSTTAYRLRKRHVEAEYGIQIIEV